MARTLPTAISNALAATGAQPSLSVTLQDAITRFNQLAAIPSGATGQCASFVTAVGTILRARIPQASSPATIAVQRITSPTTASQWTGTYSTITTTARAEGGCGFAQSGSTVRCFYQNSTSANVCYRDSTDDGVTWSAETSLPANPIGPAGICYGICADSPTSVWAMFSSASYASAILYHAVYSAGSWGSAGGGGGSGTIGDDGTGGVGNASWANVGPASPPWGQVRGISVVTNGTTLVFMAGVQLRASTTALGGIAVGVCTYNTSTQTFSAWTQILPMDNGAIGLARSYPGFAFDGTKYYLAAQLQDSGAISGTAQSRTALWTSTDLATWTPIAAAGPALDIYGAQLAVLSGAIYLFDPVTVYQTQGTQPITDVSADVLSLLITEAEGADTAFTLVLSNNAGQYTGAILTNTSVLVALGYNGTAISTHRGYVDSVTYEANGSICDVTLTCRGISKFLDQVTPRLTVLTGKTLAQLVTWVCAQANVPLAALPTTTQFSQVIPCFVTTPGETYAQALKRLANIYSFSQFEDPTPEVRIVDRSASDASVYSYSTQPLALAVSQSADRANIIRVIGSTGTNTTVFADALDSTNLPLAGGERYRHVVERMLDTAARCALKASLLMHDEVSTATRGTATITINPAHEVMDVIDLTDSRLGLSTTHLRIHGITTTIDWQNGTWLQHLDLQGP